MVNIDMKPWSAPVTMYRAHNRLNQQISSVQLKVDRSSNPPEPAPRSRSSWSVNQSSIDSNSQTIHFSCNLSPSVPFQINTPLPPTTAPDGSDHNLQPTLLFRFVPSE
ncbi:hypothetical protein HPP92_018210 [Vanilla planifolia]|uniref:Uncharacterized protein n=1 Tax=Vanilla planifolia TaxID=51239 RepID=A0A835QJJ0_VANPL|nr:hypothetical protein HPP92_018797 [Vanilla planifolia]KAG0468882.1 hypothetical protein HPP92_018210 [Vanilla planifolia]